MKRLVAQLKESTKSDYDPEEKGEVVGVGEHHGGDIHVYLAHKVTKLREVQASNWKEQSSTIFKGCIIYINGLTDPPIDEMRRLIGTNGGECIQYRAVKITHLVCNYYTDAQLKLECAKIKLNANNRVYYVTDRWVRESVRQGKRLDENGFVPAGMDRQQGNTLTTLFSSASATSSATLPPEARTVASVVMPKGKSHQYDSLQPLKRHRSEHSSNSEATAEGLVALTPSQLEFIAFLPHELRAEALMQIERMRDATIDKCGTAGLQYEISTTGSSSSSSGANNARHNGTVEVLPSGGTSNAVSGMPQEAALRKRRLTDLVDHLHRNGDGSYCSSKVTRQRVVLYLQQLVASLVGMPCPPAYAMNSAALVGLLSDYTRWLCSERRYDQLRRQVEGAAAKLNTGEEGVAAVTSLRQVVDLVSKSLTPSMPRPG